MTARILVVDDEPDLEALILQKFRRQIRDGAIGFLFAQDGIEAVLKPDAPVGGRLAAMAGLHRNALAQISVVLQGAARVVALVVAVAVALPEQAGEVVVECVEVFLGLSDGYAGFEACEWDVVAVVAVEAEVVEVDCEWGEDLVVGKLTGESGSG